MTFRGLYLVRFLSFHKPTMFLQTSVWVYSLTLDGDLYHTETIHLLCKSMDWFLFPFFFIHCWKNEDFHNRLLHFLCSDYPIRIMMLTQFWPMFPFYNPNQNFSGVFSGYKMLTSARDKHCSCSIKRCSLFDKVAGVHFNTPWKLKKQSFSTFSGGISIPPENVEKLCFFNFQGGQQLY